MTVTLALHGKRRRNHARPQFDALRSGEGAPHQNDGPSGISVGARSEARTKLSSADAPVCSRKKDNAVHGGTLIRLVRSPALSRSFCRRCRRDACATHADRGALLERLGGKAATSLADGCAKIGAGVAARDGLPRVDRRLPREWRKRARQFRDHPGSPASPTKHSFEGVRKAPPLATAA